MAKGSLRLSPAPKPSNDKAPVIFRDRRNAEGDMEPDNNKWTDITSDNDRVLSFWADVLEAEEIEFTGDHKQQLAVLKAIPGDDKDETVFRARIEALKAAKPVVREVAPMDVANIEDELKFAGRFIRNGVVTQLEEGADIAEQHASKPLAIDAALMKVKEKNAEGNEISWQTACSQLPWPGSRHDDAEKKKWNPQGGNARPDNYKVGDEARSRLAQVFDASPTLGVKYKEAIDLAKTVVEAKGNLAGFTAEQKKLLQDMSGFKLLQIEQQPVVQANLVSRLNKRRTNEVGRFRTACKFRQTVDRLASLPKVDWEFVTGGKTPNDVTLTLTKPIALSAQRDDDPKKWTEDSKPISISEFCALRIEATKAAGQDTLRGLLAITKAAKKRPPKTAGTPEKTLSDKEGGTLPTTGGWSPAQLLVGLQRIEDTLSEETFRKKCFEFFAMKENRDQLSELMDANAELVRFAGLFEETYREYRREEEMKRLRGSKKNGEQKTA